MQPLKVLKISCSIDISLIGFEVKIRTLSTNNADLSVKSSILMPDKMGESFMNLDRGSIAKVNSNDDKGQPWRVPLDNGTVSYINPEVII